jgi:tetratricopeptide (TPR) repeat protein
LNAIDPDPKEGDPSPRQPLRPQGQRAYRGPEYKSKEIDSAARARVIKLLVESGYAGAAGLLMGMVVDYKTQGPFPWTVALALGFWLIAAAVGFVVSEASGWLGSQIHAPSGSSTPHRREYSRAQALTVQGHFEDAIGAYEHEISEDPRDPEPYFGIVRILRDKLDRPEEAAVWLRRVYRESQLHDGQRLLAIREFIELFQSRLEEPLKATPWLAQIAETRSGTPDGDFAREQLTRIRAELSEGAAE